MRDIIFRGKCTVSEKWIEGSLVDSIKNEPPCIWKKSEDYESNLGGFEVYHNSIGQWTGFVDQKGSKIFENDLLSYRGSKAQAVVWSSDYGCFHVNIGDNPKATYLSHGLCAGLLIVGNKYDGYNEVIRS